MTNNVLRKRTPPMSGVFLFEIGSQRMGKNVDRSILYVLRSGFNKTRGNDMKGLKLASAAILFSACQVAVAAIGGTTSQMEKGLKKHLGEVPQCTVIEVPEARLLNNGANAFYSLKGLTSFDMLVELDGGKIKEVTVVNMDRNEQVMRDMMCMSYAFMRLLQPELSDQSHSMKEAKRLWELTAQAGKPFKKAHFFNNITAQLVPVQFVVK